MKKMEIVGTAARGPSDYMWPHVAADRCLFIDASNPSQKIENQKGNADCPISVQSAIY